MPSEAIRIELPWHKGESTAPSASLGESGSDGRGMKVKPVVGDAMSVSETTVVGGDEEEGTSARRIASWEDVLADRAGMSVTATPQRADGGNEAEDDEGATGEPASCGWRGREGPMSGTCCCCIIGHQQLITDDPDAGDGGGYSCVLQ